MRVVKLWRSSSSRVGRGSSSVGWRIEVCVGWGEGEDDSEGRERDSRGRVRVADEAFRHDDVDDDRGEPSRNGQRTPCVMQFTQEGRCSSH